MATLFEEIRWIVGDAPDGVDRDMTGANYIIENGQLQGIIDRFAYRDTDASTGWSVDILKVALEYARQARLVRVEVNPERSRRFDQRVRHLQVEYVNNAGRNLRETTAPGASQPLTDTVSQEIQRAITEHAGMANIHHTPPEALDQAAVDARADTVISDRLATDNRLLEPASGDDDTGVLGTSTELVGAEHQHPGQVYTSAEKTKLSGIEAGAQVNVGSEFTAAEKTKLSGIEAGATADQTGSEIVNALQGLSGANRLDASAVKNLPTGGGGLSTVVSDETLDGTGAAGSPLSVANPFTSTDETKLDNLLGLPTGGAADQLLAKKSATDGDAEWRTITTGGGGLASVSSDATLSGDGTSGSPLGVVNPFTDDDETKLDGIDAGAEVNLFVGVFAAAPAVANYTAGQVYYNSTDNRLYELIAPAAMSASLTLSFTPRNTAAQGAGDSGAGFNADPSDPVNERYGVSPLTGWLKLQQVVDTGRGQTRYYLESEANDAVFGGSGFSITLADGRVLNFTRESSSGGVSAYTSTGETSPRIFQVGTAQTITVHANGTTPFAAGVNKQWHYLPVGAELYNALTGVSIEDDDLVFTRHAGAAVTADLSPYETEPWARPNNTDLIPADKIPVAESLIDGNGIGLTSGGGQSLRGPLRLFDPPQSDNWDLDDTDKRTGVYHVRVRLNITDIDATTSFSSTSVVRSVTLTARLLGSVLRQDSERYSDSSSTPQGEQVGESQKVYRGGTEVGTPTLLLATDSDARLGYYLDWVRVSGSSSISFTLTDFRVDFAHSDTSGAADAPAAVSGMPGVLARETLSAAVALAQPTANTIGETRWQDIFSHTVTAAEAARGFIDFNVNVYATVTSGSDEVGNRPLLAIRLIQGTEVRSENYRYFRFTVGTPLDCILSEVLAVASGDVVKVQAQMIRLSAATATVNAMVTTASHWSRFSFSGGGGLPERKVKQLTLASDVAVPEGGRSDIMPFTLAADEAGDWSVYATILASVSVTGGGSGTRATLSQGDLAAAVSLAQPVASTVGATRWQDIFSHTITAAEAARGFMEIDADVVATIANGSDDSVDRPMLAVRLIQGTEHRGENQRYFRFTAGTPLTCPVSGVIQVASGDVIKVQAQMIWLTQANTTLNASVTTDSHWSRLSFSGGGQAAAGTLGIQLWRTRGADTTLVRFIEPFDTTVSQQSAWAVNFLVLDAQAADTYTMRIVDYTTRGTTRVTVRGDGTTGRTHLDARRLA